MYCSLLPRRELEEFAELQTRERERINLEKEEKEKNIQAQRHHFLLSTKQVSGESMRCTWCTYIRHKYMCIYLRSPIEKKLSVWSMKTCVYSYSRAPNCCNHLLIYIFFSEIPLAIMCLNNYDEVLWPLLIQQQCGVNRYFILWPLLHAFMVITASCGHTAHAHVPALVTGRLVPATPRTGQEDITASCLQSEEGNQEIIHIC